MLNGLSVFGSGIQAKDHGLGTVQRTAYPTQPRVPSPPGEHLNVRARLVGVFLLFFWVPCFVLTPEQVYSAGLVPLNHPSDVPL